MIVMKQPSSLELFFVMKGSVVPRIGGKILGIALLSTIVIVVDSLLVSLPRISIAAMGVFGVALSLFLGFRNNAAYDRWWEARKLWGALIGDIRTLGRQLDLFVSDDDTRRFVLTHSAAFAHLHRGYLRACPVKADVVKWVSEADGEVLLQQGNAADAALRTIGRRLRRAREQKLISGYGQLAMAQTLSAIGMSQAGCERILGPRLIAHAHSVHQGSTEWAETRAQDRWTLFKLLFVVRLRFPDEPDGRGHFTARLCWRSLKTRRFPADLRRAGRKNDYRRMDVSNEF
ncbi:bestrophin family protein [Coralliovum pocilloporae]|uniref:bestrophin family protein n=1 Tax=Coralliovum pocilloporae TaxID=3066369 RepID=UPI0033072636